MIHFTLINERQVDFWKEDDVLTLPEYQLECPMRRGDLIIIPGVVVSPGLHAKIQSHKKS